MKKVFLAACVLVAGGLLHVSWSWSFPQKEPTKPTGPRARVAILNLSHVIKNHPKYQAVQKEITEASKPDAVKEKNLKKQADALRAELRERAATLTAEEKGAFRQQLNELEDRIEANRAAAKAAGMKVANERMKALYREVKEAVQRHATAHAIDLVLHCNDADPLEGRNSPQNTVHQWQTDCCLALYAASGVDISKEILDALKRK